MGKLLLGALFLLFPAMSPQGKQAPEIHINPLPPTQGQSVTIEYTGVPGTRLHLNWDPPASPAAVNIGANGTATVTVPANATSLVVSDPTPNGAANETTVITPQKR